MMSPMEPPKLFDVADFSKAAAMAFLEDMISSGKIKASTGQSWRSAARKVLADFSDDQDVRAINIEEAVRALESTEAKNLSKLTLLIYRRRTESLIREFQRYLESPDDYDGVRDSSEELNSDEARHGARAGEDSGHQQSRGSSASSRSAPIAAETATKLGVNGALGQARAEVLPVVALTAKDWLNVPFPLRPDSVATVQIPRDLTKDEAGRLCTFIQALAQPK